MAEDTLILGRFFSPLLNSFSDSRKQGEKGKTSAQNHTWTAACVHLRKLVLQTLFNQKFV